MKRYLYRYAGYSIGANVYDNGFSFTLSDKPVSEADLRATLQATGAHKETIESVINDAYQEVRETALEMGWADTAKLTIRAS